MKVTETETFVVCNVEYQDEPTQKIIPVLITGLGCAECQYAYIKAQASEMGRYMEDDRLYTMTLQDPSQQRLIREYGSTAPTRRQAMIDVTDLVIEMERTPMRASQ